MKKLKIFLMLLCGTLIVSCESNTIQDVSGIVLNPTYNANIKQVIDAQCASCHNPNGSQNNSVLDNYADLNLACQTDINGNGTVLCKIEGSCGSIMPQSGKMPQATIDMINRWVTNNYPN
jgi:predicted CXXCH cytochrome family protein